MNDRSAIDRVRFRTMTTKELRSSLLVDDLFEPGELALTYFETERAIVGSATPLDAELLLQATAGMAADFFCQRRELGVLNIGGPGGVTVDGTEHRLDKHDCLYVGRGAQKVSFASKNTELPAKLYLLSYPAHADHPTALCRRADAVSESLGTNEEANRRTIHKCIHQGGIPSCQLVMGYTTVAPGSVWNTMAPHTHARRSEIYMYFDLGDGAVVHLMGEPGETRHLIVRDRQAVMSPTWSIHSGAGTRAYTFCWGMGGENQEFADMDQVAIGELL